MSRRGGGICNLDNKIQDGDQNFFKTTRRYELNQILLIVVPYFYLYVKCSHRKHQLQTLNDFENTALQNLTAHISLAAVRRVDDLFHSVCHICSLQQVTMLKIAFGWEF